MAWVSPTRPRGVDVSPYFEVVKPTLVRGFNYKDLAWADLEGLHALKNSAPSQNAYAS